MARRLVQPKLRLLRNTLHASTAAQVSFLVSRHYHRTGLALDPVAQPCPGHGGHHQNIALAVIAVPLLTAVSFGLAAVSGKPGFGLLGTAMGFAALGAALAISNIFTVVAPYPMDKRAGNPMRQAAQGYSSYQFLAVFGSVGGTAIAVLPLIFATVLSNADPAADTAAVRRRVRRRAGPGRCTDRGRRGRAQAARAGSDRHPHQAVGGLTSPATSGMPKTPGRRGRRHHHRRLAGPGPGHRTAGPTV